MKYFYWQFLYSYESIVLTSCKSLISIYDTSWSTTGWIQSKNFRKQCLTQNFQSGLPRLWTDSKACWCRYAGGLQLSTRKHNSASSKHLYIKIAASAHADYHFPMVVLWTMNSLENSFSNIFEIFKYSYFWGNLEIHKG